MKINYVTDSMHSRGGSVFWGEASKGASYKGAAFNDAAPGGQSSGVMRGIKASGGKERAGEFERQDNYDNINTSIKRNPDARVSFKGDAKKIAEPALHWCAKRAHKYPIIAESIFLIPVICVLKPITLLAMAKNDDEKKKYRYQAAKSIASGLAGLAMAAVVGKAVTSGVEASEKAGLFKKIPDNIKEESEKVINKGIKALKSFVQELAGKTSLNDRADRAASRIDTDVLTKQISKLTEQKGRINLNVFHNHHDKVDTKAVKEFIGSIGKISPDAAKAADAAISVQTEIEHYSRTAKDIADKLMQPFSMPLRAELTFLAIPPILGFLGLKKPCKSKGAPAAVQTKSNFGSLERAVFHDKNCKAVFSPFQEGRK